MSSSINTISGTSDYVVKIRQLETADDILLHEKRLRRKEYVSLRL
jgi:hypothetical protein